MAPGVRAELDALVLRLGRAPGNALLHGDPCPGNDLHTTGGVRFIDFEQAAWGSGLMELAYLRIGFPTCWCVTASSEALLHRAEDAYRTAWHAETGAALPVDLTDACAGWLIRGDALVPARGAAAPTTWPASPSGTGPGAPPPLGSGCCTASLSSAG